MQITKTNENRISSSLLNWWVLVLVAGLVVFLNSPSAHANSEPYMYYGVSITDVAVQASPRDGNSVLRFRLVNESAEPMIIIGVESESWAGSRIMARTGRGKLADLGSISVPGGETLDLNSSHLSFELTGLKQQLQTGQVIPLNLVLMRGKIPIEAHVHDFVAGRAQTAARVARISLAETNY